MAVTSVPVSIWKWVSVPSSFSETVQGEVFFPEFKTRRECSVQAQLLETDQDPTQSYRTVNEGLRAVHWNSLEQGQASK